MKETAKKLIKGVTLNLGGEDYVIPPLNLDQLEEYTEIIEKLGTPGITNQETYNIIATLAAAALSRNYPDITLEQVRTMLDLGNIIAVNAAVMGGSGFTGEPQAGE
jgi:hypothetical protein